MNDVPTLSRRDIEEQLDKLEGSKRSHHLFAFFGTGGEDLISLARWGQFNVVPVRSELELRERMPPLENEDARVAFLVPWTSDVPLDLAGRFALGGRVQRVGPEARLKRLFGVAEVDSEARSSALASYLLRPGQENSYPITTGGRLSPAAMWAAWLRADWGVETEGGLALDTLLGWGALDGRGPQWQKAMGAPEARGVRDEILKHLEVQLDAAGVATWTAWEASRGRSALELAILFEALASAPHAGVRMWARQAVRAGLGVDSPEAADRVVQLMGRASAGALRYVLRRADASEVRALVNAADARVDDPEVREALAASIRLPSGWKHRLDTLGNALAAAAAEPSTAAVQAAAAALRALESHVFFPEVDSLHIVRRAEMAVRLTAWLAESPARRLEGGLTAFSDVEKLGRWYVEDGGFVDWARRWARGSAADAFGRGVAAVITAVDRLRTDLDRRFARGLRSWVEAGRPANMVLPIDRAVERLACKFLDENPERRLLVLLFDGMAWAQAAELLLSLGERSAPWGPLAWLSSKAGKVGEGRYPVVLAGLPTVTEVSRAAFFAGKPTGVGAATSTEKDVERWQHHRAVGAFAKSPDVPRLLLRSEGHSPDGTASEEALSLVADRSRRIVAMVINAIDASLKSDPQVLHLWTADRIRSLADLLEKAREAGRAVLVASDHGHVPADLLAPAGYFEKAGARWRPLAAADDPVAEYEVAFATGGAVWGPKGSAGVALIADDAHRFGGGAHAGEHGGATMAEVVAPCVLIGCDDGLGPRDDKGLDVGPAYVPSWWHYEVHEAVARATVVPALAPPSRAKNEKQLSLLEPTPPPPVASPVAKESPLAASKLLHARASRIEVRRQAVDAVAFLVERNGVAPEGVFASAMKVLPFRVGGLIALLQETLNVDGYEILRHDRAGKQVLLDRAKLEQQFEVKL